MRQAHITRWRKWFAPMCVGALLLFATASRAQAIDPKLAVPILLKVITYDQGFEARGTGPFVILVVSEPGQAAAREQILGVLRALSVSSIKSRPLRFVGAEVKDAASLGAAVAKEEASALLAVPGLSTAGQTAIGQTSEAKRIYSLALDSEMVERAVVLGVTNNGGRPQIVINERAARAAGVKFETSVLRLAKVVH